MLQTFIDRIFLTTLFAHNYVSLTPIELSDANIFICNRCFNKRLITFDTAPTDGIKNLTITSQSASQLQLSWQPPTASPCIATKYLVQYTVINQDQCAELNIGPRDYAEVYQTMVLLSGVLVPHSTYTVFVSPKNDAGLGPVTQVTAVTSDQG